MLLTNEAIKEIEEKIGYVFKDKTYLDYAFTRKSYSEERKMLGETVFDNELLEFYGDSALNYVLVDFLAMKSWKIAHIDGSITIRTPEEYSNFISFWTDKTMLSTRMSELGISKYLIMSKGDQNKNVQNNLSAQEDLFEAIIGAIWLDLDQNTRKTQYYAFNMLRFQDSSVCYEKNPFMQLKEFCDKNPDYSYAISAKDYGYDFVIANTKNKAHHTVKIKQDNPRNYHVAQAEGAKDCIEYLKDKGLWDGKKRLVSPNFTYDNVVNKLQELFQKKIIQHQVTYVTEYNYIEGEWECKCTVGDGTVFSAFDNYKVDAKKKAAVDAYNYILKNYEKIKF